MKSDLDVARAKAADLLEVARSHGAQLKKSSGEWIGPCPACGGSDRFAIKPAKNVWHCRGCGGRGDVIDLEMHLTGASFVEAVRALTGENKTAPTAKRTPRDPTTEELAAKAAEQRRRQFNEATAAEIVATLRPVVGTPGEDYLRDVRCIDLNHWAIRRALEDIETLGWSEQTYFHQPDPNEPSHELHGQWLGAIVAILTDAATGERTGGITRTFVHQGRKIGKAMSLGGAGRTGIIRLTPDDEVLTGLHIAEGLETSLAGMMLGFVPMWATGSTTQMAKLPVLDGIEHITIFADNDENGAGKKAAIEAGLRWRAAGRQVRVRETTEPGDINDLVRRAQ